jgi:hypothetical protein
MLHRSEFINGLAMIVPVIFAEDEKRSVPPYKVLIEEPLADAGVTPMEEEILGMSVIRTRKWLTDLRAEPQIPYHENGDPEFLSRIVCMQRLSGEESLG